MIKLTDAENKCLELLIQDLKEKEKNLEILGVATRAGQAIGALFDKSENFSDPNTMRLIFLGLSILYHPDKNTDPNAESIFKLIPKITNDFEMLKNISDRLNNVVSAAKNQVNHKPAAAPDYQKQNPEKPTQPNYNARFWDDFNRQNEENIRKAREELKKRQEEKAARQKYQDQQDQGKPRENDYGKAEFFRQQAQARQQYYNPPNQDQKYDPNENPPIIPKLDEIIASMQNAYEKMQRSDSDYVREYYYKRILQAHSSAIISIRLLKPELINNPKLKEREHHIKEILHKTEKFISDAATQKQALHRQQQEELRRQEELRTQQENIRKAREAELRKRQEQQAAAAPAQQQALRRQEELRTQQENIRKAREAELKKRQEQQAAAAANQKHQDRYFNPHVGELLTKDELMRKYREEKAARQNQDQNYNNDAAAQKQALSRQLQELRRQEELRRQQENIRKAQKAREEELRKQQAEQEAARAKYFKQPTKEDPLKYSREAPTPATEQLLTTEQMAIVKEYFAENVGKAKLSRKEKLFDKNNNPISLPYSIIKSDDGKLYVLYRGKSAYANLNPKGKKGLLGEGSFGRVKLAKCLDDGTIVAAKMALTNEYQTANDIQKEQEMQRAVGQYLGAANRKNFRQKNKYYTFSKFIEGSSLADCFFIPNSKNRLTQNKPILEKLEIILAALKATQELHANGIIHCDLSFNNILFNHKTKQATIIDLGLAVKTTTADLIKLPVTYFPNGYHPPEFARGFANYNSDIYSLGKWIQFLQTKERYKDTFLEQLSFMMTNTDPRNRAGTQSCITQIERQISSIQKQSNHDGYRPGRL